MKYKTIELDAQTYPIVINAILEWIAMAQKTSQEYLIKRHPNGCYITYKKEKK